MVIRDLQNGQYSGESSGESGDAAIKILKQNDEEEYPRLCEEALKEADIIANATHRMSSKNGIVTLYGVVVGTVTPEIASFFKIRDGIWYLQSRPGFGIRVYIPPQSTVPSIGIEDIVVC